MAGRSCIRYAESFIPVKNVKFLPTFCRHERAADQIQTRKAVHSGLETKIAIPSSNRAECGHCFRHDLEDLTGRASTTSLPSWQASEAAFQVTDTPFGSPTLALRELGSDSPVPSEIFVNAAAGCRVKLRRFLRRFVEVFPAQDASCKVFGRLVPCLCVESDTILLLPQETAWETFCNFTSCISCCLQRPLRRLDGRCNRMDEALIKDFEDRASLAEQRLAAIEGMIGIFIILGPCFTSVPGHISLVRAHVELSCRQSTRNRGRHCIIRNPCGCFITAMVLLLTIDVINDDADCNHGQY